MFCTQCGRQVPDNSTFCDNCGAVIQPPTASLPYPVVPEPAGTTPAARTDGKATASLVLGILSITMFSILAGIPAIILGHMSRGEIKRSMGRLKGEGLALAGLIMGYISLLIIPFILIIAAIAIPNLLRARYAANEASAISSVRRINTAVVTYQAEKQGYPENLGDLREAGYLDSALARGEVQGYSVEYSAADSDGDGVREKYFVIATPKSPGAHARRSFCSDETGVIRYERGSECTVESAIVD